MSTNIPLIIVGKPGTGKSMSSQLIYNSMRGKYSKNKFFRQFPQIVLTYFQGAESTKPEDIEKLFEIAENKLDFYKNKEEFKNEKIPISMILFHELGFKPPKYAHIAPIMKNDDGNKRKLSFVISILNNPKLLLLDEPTVGIDTKSKNNMELYKKIRL